MEQKANLTVVGSNNIDLTSFLKRFPQRGETVYGREFKQGFGGKGSNQAVMASLLGANVSMVTCVGADVYGENWLKHYKKEGINTDFVKIEEGMNSGVAAIWVEADGDNRIVIQPGANNALNAEYVKEAVIALPKPKVVLSQLENPQEAIVAGFKQGQELDAVTVLNPAPADILDDEMLEYTDWLLPNETEFAFLAREMFGISVDDLTDAIKTFAQKTRTNMVVTIGNEGALLYQPEMAMDVIHIETMPVDVVDTTGAGDAFCGTFAYGLANGLMPKLAVTLANAVASDSVQRTGTQISYARGDQLTQIVQKILK